MRLKTKKYASGSLLRLASAFHDACNSAENRTSPTAATARSGRGRAVPSRLLVEEIVDGRAVSSQEQLRGLLSERGIEATQATLSRDLDEMAAVYALQALIAARLDANSPDDRGLVQDAAGGVIGAAAALLPWFSTKYAPMSAVLTVIVLLRLKRTPSLFPDLLRNPKVWAVIVPYARMPNGTGPIALRRALAVMRK